MLVIGYKMNGIEHPHDGHSDSFTFTIVIKASQKDYQYRSRMTQMGLLSRDLPFSGTVSYAKDLGHPFGW